MVVISMPMRMPNGYGSVYKLSGKRRNPYVARKTIGFNEKNQPIYKIIGYSKTRKDAIQMLSNYNKEQNRLANKSLMFSEVFEMWFTWKLKEELSESRYKNIKSLYNTHLKSLYFKTFSEITLKDLQKCIDNAQKVCKKATLLQIKLLFGEMYKYAIFNDITEKNIATMLKLPKLDDRKEKVPFTSAEIEVFKHALDEFG